MLWIFHRSLYYVLLLTVSYFFVDTSQDFLTINNIVNFLTHHQLSDQWVKVAEELKVPNRVLSSIVVSHQNDDEASLRKVLAWWFKNTPNPEWSTIQNIGKGNSS